LPSEIQAAYLWGQLERSEDITENRLATWSGYKESLVELEQLGQLFLQDRLELQWHNFQHFGMLEIYPPAVFEYPEKFLEQH
jgi:dTDP-4-amino-4,6-dideoxygalactose transaminase